MLTAVQHCFSVGPPVQGDFFIDRTGLLKSAAEFLSSSGGNLVITGPRRAGKTSLCLKLLEIVSELRTVLSAYMSMEANYEQGPDRFTQGVLLHAIKSVAFSIFSKSYSELLDDLGKPFGLDSRYGRLLRLFEHARRSSGSVGHSRQKEVGASMLAQAKLGEMEKIDLALPQLSPFEYLALLDELVTFMQANKVSRFILFIDEANKLTLEANSRLIRENLALFSSKGMQFCFVTTPDVVAAVPAAHELFHHRVDVGPFDEPGAICKLIERCCMIDGARVTPEQIFSSEAVSAIWRISRGLPFRIQILCQESLATAANAGHTNVTLTDVLDVISEMEFRI